jgi:hypothetical protein
MLAEGAGRQRDLGRPLGDDEWDLLRERGTREQFERGKMVPEQIRDEILTMRRTYASGRAPRLKGPSAHRRDNRQRRVIHERALAELFVAHLEQQPHDHCGVRAFRRDVLNDARVTDVRTWLDAEVRRQGRPTIRAGRVSLVSIKCDGEIIRRATRRNSRLDRLRHVSERLAEFYGWEPADAATYVLTHTRPPVQAITGHVSMKWPVPCRSRIMMTIDPTTPPSEVATVYGQLRNREFGRVRRLDAKHAALATFAVQHDDQPIGEQMAIWNRTKGKAWRYRFPSVFKRDARLAIGSLAELRPHRRRA